MPSSEHQQVEVNLMGSPTLPFPVDQGKSSMKTYSWHQLLHLVSLFDCPALQLYREITFLQRNNTLGLTLRAPYKLLHNQL